MRPGGFPRLGAAWGEDRGKREGRKVFFFEKKKLKTFANCSAGFVTHGRSVLPVTDKSFLVLFFKKEHSFFLSRRPLQGRHEAPGGLTSFCAGGAITFVCGAIAAGRAAGRGGGIAAGGGAAGAGRCGDFTRFGIGVPGKRDGGRGGCGAAGGGGRQA